jgi:hypothetical protein
MTGGGRVTTRWVGETLLSTRLHVVEVSAGIVRRLAGTLPDPFESPTVRLDVTEHRPLAKRLVGDIAYEVLARVRTGPGLAVLTGAGLAELTDDQLRYLIVGISLVAGLPMKQNPEGDRLVSVRDEHPADPNVRGYRTRKGLKMHTDAADMAGLLCLRQGRDGGVNWFAHSCTVHDVLVDEVPRLVPELYRDWEWDRRGLEPPGEPPTLTSPVYSYYGGMLSCRYAPALLREGAARAGGALTPERVAVLDRFDEVAHRGPLTVTHRMARGESVWFDNYRILHAREEFVDGGAVTEQRHLLRTWVWLDEPPPLAAHFASPREVY